MTTDNSPRVGFIGLGVMGEPMCENLAKKLPGPVIAFDRAAEPLARLKPAGVESVDSTAALAGRCDIVFLSLPDGSAVQQVCLGPDGLLAHMKPGTTLVDMSTSPVELTRALATQCAAREIGFADAPVARTREAAIRGDLSIMVGCDEATFQFIKPFLACMGSEINHCGDAGCGQIVKILNNMVLFQNVCALAEAMGIARRSGLSEEVLLSVMSKGSGDSFALRNHGMKAMLPRTFPERAFPTDYAKKDLSYALALAQSAGIDAAGAELVMERFEASRAAGFANEYFPAVLKVIDPATD
ncbi:MAG: NAD(P)-dependent oxidoreductase [Burkholderiaceae bacterium]